MVMGRTPGKSSSPYYVDTGRHAGFCPAFWSLGDWPNAGEFFHLPSAVILTVFLAADVIAALKAGDKRITSLATVLAAPLLLVWFINGFGQLLNCAE